MDKEMELLEKCEVFISKDNCKEAISLLKKDYVENKEIIAELSLLESRFVHTSKEYNTGLITHEQKSVLNTRIKHTLLQLIIRLRESPKTAPSSDEIYLRFKKFSDNKKLKDIQKNFLDFNMQAWVDTNKLVETFLHELPTKFPKIQEDFNINLKFETHENASIIHFDKKGSINIEWHTTTYSLAGAKLTINLWNKLMISGQFYRHHSYEPRIIKKIILRPTIDLYLNVGWKGNTSDFIPTEELHNIIREMILERLEVLINHKD